MINDIICNFKKEHGQIKDVFWNTIGGGLFAVQSAILLYFVVRLYGQEEAGIISLAYAVATLSYTVAKYGIRNYQVTDLQEQYSFEQYIVCRIWTTVFAVCAVMVYFAIQYLLNEYTVYKILIIIEIVFLRMINAVEDVFIGRLQQVGMFAVGARIMAIREFLTILTMIAAIAMGLNILWVILAGTMAGLCVDFFLIRINKNCFRGNRINCDEKSFNIRNLLRECFPLCISTSLAIYAGNIPKYAIEWYLNEYAQAVFGYLILPAFTITLLNQFVYLPFVKELGLTWIENDKYPFIKTVVKQSVMVIIISMVVMAVSFWIGIPLLSRLYAIDLRPYEKEFRMLLCGGSLFALEFYLTIPITTMRNQRSLAFGYIIAIVISAFTQRVIVLEKGMMGAAILYVIVNAILSLCFIFIICKGVKRAK